MYYVYADCGFRESAWDCTAGQLPYAMLAVSEFDLSQTERSECCRILNQYWFCRAGRAIVALAGDRAGGLSLHME